MYRSLRAILSTMLLMPCLAYGKRYAVKDVIAASDSLMSFIAGDSLFRHCTFDSTSYYAHAKGDGFKYERLTASLRTEKNFEKAYVRYTVSIPLSDCKVLDTVRGVITLELDTALALVNEPDFSFIPQIAYSKDKCELLGSDTAIQIAKQQGLILGVAAPHAHIKYRAEDKTLVWVVQCIIWNEKGARPGVTTMNDVVVLDAKTGALLEHKKVPYAPNTYY